mgnify:CR=1 FL=1
MPSGDTFVTTVEEGLNTMLATSRTTREYPADVMLKLCDRKTLAAHTGTAFREFLAATLTAQDYGETDTIDNPQELDGSILTATPQLVAVQTFIGKRVEARLDRKAFATFGNLAQEAIQRKKNRDAHSLFATAGTTLGGTTVTIVSGHIMAAATRIMSDADEAGPEPIFAVLHGLHLFDIQSEILGGVGTYPIPTGYTQETFMRGFKGGLVGGPMVYVDGLIVPDATPDARGGVFSKMSLLLVQGMTPWKETRPEPQKGYGGTSVWLKDEYIWAERSPGNWLYGILGDATVPTG